MKIEDGVVIVTGAGSGVGHALTESFAAAGARVVVSDVNADDARSTAELITAAGHVAVPLRADACIEADIRALTALAAAEFGPVEIYVANAGVAGPPGLGLPEGDWDHAMEVNLHAHVRAASVLIPEWMERGGGHSVSIASAAGLLTQIGAAAYAVSKHAAVGFAEWLAIAYGDSGIGVTRVCPMGVNTPLLKSTLESPDPLDRFMGRSIINAGAVIEPRLVAEVTLNAVRDGTFSGLAAAARAGPVPAEGGRPRPLDRGHAAVPQIPGWTTSVSASPKRDAAHEDARVGQAPCAICASDHD